MRTLNADGRITDKTDFLNSNPIKYAQFEISNSV